MNDNNPQRISDSLRPFLQQWYEIASRQAVAIRESLWGDFNELSVEKGRLQSVLQRYCDETSLPCQTLERSQNQDLLTEIFALEKANWDHLEGQRVETLTKTNKYLKRTGGLVSAYRPKSEAVWVAYS